MSKLHYITALLIIIFLAIASGGLFELMDDSPESKKEVLRHDPDYYLKNFSATTMDDSGKPAYKVKAAYLEHYPDTNNMKLQQPVFSFYEHHQPAWTARADEALMQQKSQIINLSGNVILKQLAPLTSAKSGNKDISTLTLTAKQLTIEAKRNIAHTKSEINLSKGSNTIQATGMRADMNERKIEFLSQTRSHYVLPAR